MSCPAHRQQEAEAALATQPAVYVPPRTIVQEKRAYKRIASLPERIIVPTPLTDRVPISLASGGAIEVTRADFQKLYEKVY